MNDNIVVISGSAPLPSAVVDGIAEESIILAVDGGLDHALAAGLAPSGVIGDMDSVTPGALAWAHEHAIVSRHPADKNQTDTELALAFAAEMTPERLTLIGGGDRLDHTLAAIGALGHSALTSVPRLDAWWNGQHIDVLHGPGSAELELEPDSILSLVALHGPCTGVSVTGVRWPLDNAPLAPAIGLGISNEVVDGEVRIRLSRGILTVFDQPVSPPSVSQQQEETS